MRLSWNYEKNLSLFSSVPLNSFEHDSIRRSSSRNDSLEENSNNFPDYYTECKKEASTPPSNHLRTNNNNNINNNHDNNNQNLQLHLKTEPICNPSSPESSSIDVPPATGMDDCAGCGRLIQVSFFYLFCFHYI